MRQVPQGPAARRARPSRAHRRGKSPLALRERGPPGTQASRLRLRGLLTQMKEIVMSEGKTTENKTQSVVDAIFDVAEAWATHGLKLAKESLEGSARALERTARAIDTVREKIESKKTA